MKATASKLKKVTAASLVAHQPSRAIHVEYDNESYSGIRVSKRSSGDVAEVELSSVTGVVGECTPHFKYIKPETCVFIRD